MCRFLEQVAKVALHLFATVRGQQTARRWQHGGGGISQRTAGGKMQRTYQTQRGEQADEEKVQVVEQQNGGHPST